MLSVDSELAISQINIEFVSIVIFYSKIQKNLSPFWTLPKLSPSSAVGVGVGSVGAFQIKDCQ